MTRVFRSLAVAVVLAGVSACHPSPDYRVGVDNGTALEVSLVVNGTQVASVPAHEQQFVEASALPPLPWTIEARTAGGRRLLLLNVEGGMVSSTAFPDGHSESHSAGTRVDLSCGRLDVYVGAGMNGPMPGPGVPGDCEP